MGSNLCKCTQTEVRYRSIKILRCYMGSNLQLKYCKCTQTEVRYRSIKILRCYMGVIFVNVHKQR